MRSEESMRSELQTSLCESLRLCVNKRVSATAARGLFGIKICSRRQRGDFLDSKYARDSSAGTFWTQNMLATAARGLFSIKICPRQQRGDFLASKYARDSGAGTSYLLSPHSSLLTPNSYLLTPNSSLLVPHSSLLVPHS